jgi:hypothetical protein
MQLEVPGLTWNEPEWNLNWLLLREEGELQCSLIIVIVSVVIVIVIVKVIVLV